MRSRTKGMQLSGARFARALLVPTLAWFLKKYAPGLAKLTSPLWSGQKAARRTRLREVLIVWLGSSLRTLEIDAEFARIGDLDVIDLLVSDISDEAIQRICADKNVARYNHPLADPRPNPFPFELLLQRHRI
jgi:hypothetical protein